MTYRLLALTAFLLCMQIMQAQSQPDYTRLTDDPARIKQLKEAIDKRYKKDVASLNGPYRKQLAEVYKERYDLIMERFLKNEVIAEARVQEYLQKIADQIIQKNPQLSAAGPVRLLFSRAWWANAVSLGEGTILFNIGLFSRLNNEAEAAFVISHELSHYYLDHGNRNIEAYVTTMNSEEFQKALKNIQKSSYNKNKQLENLALNLGFKSRRHSRGSEQAADSMALELMLNTGFDPDGALTCLALLDASDKDKYAAPLKLEELFNFAAYPFKKRWLESETLAFTEDKEEAQESKKLEDSLKTHPDCSLRIEVLKTAIAKHNRAAGKKFLIDEATFTQLKATFDYEALEYLYELGMVSRALFNALQMHKHDPSNPYVVGFIGKCMNRIYKSQKDHELGKIVSLPSPEFDEEYNSLLRIIQNLRLSEIAALNYYFLDAHIANGKKSEEFIAALISAKENFGKPDEKREWTQYYLNSFPKPKYAVN
jgi:Zn-dependent protease with chaperone function